MYDLDIDDKVRGIRAHFGGLDFDFAIGFFEVGLDWVGLGLVRWMFIGATRPEGLIWERLDGDKGAGGC